MSTEVADNAYETDGFVLVCDRDLSSTGKAEAPAILALYEKLEIAKSCRTALDFGCGTGAVARVLADGGLVVTGVDRSRKSLEVARRNHASLVAEGRLRFVEGDVGEEGTDVGEGFGLVTMINAVAHLPDVPSIERLLATTFGALRPGGLLAIDWYTEGLGFQTGWSGALAYDRGDYWWMKSGVVQRSQRRAFMQVTGFVECEDGAWERFDELLVGTIFTLEEITGALRRVGFVDVEVRDAFDARDPIADASKAAVVLVTARRREETR